MEIFDFSKRKDGTPGFMMRVNRQEAIQLIQSLSSQLATDNPNVGRREDFATLTDGDKKKEVYFSIAVSMPEPPKDLFSKFAGSALFPDKK
jgi:hypothetical protein